MNWTHWLPRANKTRRAQARVSRPQACCYRPFLEQLETRTMPSVYTDLAGTVGTLQTVETSVESTLNAVQHVPFLDQALTKVGLGDLLNNAGNALLFSKTLIGNLQTALNGNQDPSSLTKAISALPGVVQNTVVVTDNSNQSGEYLELDLELHADLDSSKNQIGAPPRLDFGLSGLPIKVDGTGCVSFKLSFDCELAIGYSTQNGHNGFFWNGKGINNNNSNPQLTLTATAGLANASVSARLGILQATLTDNPKTPTNLTATFSVQPFSIPDFQNISIPAPSLSGDAAIHLIATGTLNQQSPAVGQWKNPGADLSDPTMQFPSVTCNFDMDWPLSGTAPNPADLKVSFSNVQLQLGSLLSSFVRPLVEVVQDVTAPLQPILNFLVTPIPGVSDISQLLGQGPVTLEKVLATVASKYFGPEVQPIIDLVGELIKAVNDIDTLFQNPNDAMQANSISLNLGSFDLNSADNQDTLVNQAALFQNLSMPGTTSLFGNGISLNPNLGGDVLRDLNGVLKQLPGNVSSTITSAVNDCSKLLNQVLSSGFQFDFPILDNPAQAIIPMLLGQDPDLFSFTAQITVPPPDVNTFGGSFYGVSLSFPFDIGIDAYIHVGYDTYGIRKFFQDNFQTPADLLDGLYVSDSSHITFTGFFGPELSLNANPIFSVDLKGGLTTGNDGKDPFTITFDDPNQATDGAKDRLTSLVNQTCLFDATGEIDAGISVGFKLGYIDPLGNFWGVQHDFDIAKAVLFSYPVSPPTCLGQPQQPNLVLGEVAGGTLYLDLGGTAQGQWPQPPDGHPADILNYLQKTQQTQENFKVSQDPNGGSGPGQTLDVTAFGITQVFPNVTNIVADASGLPYDENIIIDKSVGVDATLTGGPQKNVLTYLGSGNATLNGGNDMQSQLTGGSGANTFNGGTGTDLMIGGPSAGTNKNVFQGGSGPDQFFAGPTSNDVMMGGSGNDTFNAGGGAVQMTGGSATNVYTWNEPNGTLTVQGQGTMNTLVVNGNRTVDAFTVSANGAGVIVQAPGPNPVPIHATDIQFLNLDGATAGGDTYTVNDLSGTSIQSVNVNSHEAAAASGGADTVTVYGAMNVPNQVVIHSEIDQVVQNQGNQLVNVPGSDTVVDLSNGGTVGAGGGPSHYVVRAAIPKPTDILNVNTGAAADTVLIKSTQPDVAAPAAGGHVFVNTGGGDDLITVGDPSGGLNDFLGPLNVDAGAGHNQITFDEHGSAVHDIVTLTGAQVIRSTPTAPVTVTNPDTLQTQTEIGYPFIINYKAMGGDFTPSNGSAGVIFNTAYGSTNLFIPQTGILAPTAVNCDGGFANSIDDVVVGYDGQGKTVFPSSVTQSTLDRLHSSLTVLGGAGYQVLPASILELDDKAAPSAETYTLGITGNNPVLGILQRSGASPILVDFVALLLNAGDLGNQIAVHGVDLNSTAVINAGNGNDTLSVGNAQNSLNDIHGRLTLNGQGGANQLTIHDDGTGVPETYNLGAATLTRGADVNIGFVHLSTLAFYASNNAGNNIIDVAGSPAGVPVDVFAGTGMADLNVGPLDHLQGTLSFHWAQGAKYLFVDDISTAVNDTYNLAPGMVQRTGAALIQFPTLAAEYLYAGFARPADIRVAGTPAATPLTILTGTKQDKVEICVTKMTLNALGAAVSVQGGGATELDVDDQNGSGRTYQLDTTSLLSGVPAPLFFHQIANLVLNAGPSATVNAIGSAALTNVHINLAAGINKVNVGSAINGLGSIQGPVFVTGLLGNNPSLVINDLNDVGAVTYTINAASVATSASAPIQFQNVGSLTLNGSKHGLNYLVHAIPAIPVALKGTGTNILTSPDRTNLWDLTGPSAGTLDNSITFTSMSNLIGGSGNDDFVFEKASAMPDVFGGSGINTVDFSKYGQPVAVILSGPGNGGTAFTTFFGMNVIQGSAGSTLDGSNFTGSFNTNLRVAGFGPFPLVVSGDFSASLHALNETIQNLTMKGGDLSGSVLANSINSVSIAGNFSGQIVVAGSFGTLTANSIAPTSHVWLERAGTFTVDPTGALIGLSVSNLAIVHGFSAANVTVQAQIALSVQGQSAGLVARYSAAPQQNMYFAILVDNGNGTFTAQIERNLNGIVTVLATGSAQSGIGILQLKVVGSSLMLFLGNTLLASATDTALTSGGVGVVVSQNVGVTNFSAF